MSQIAVLKGGEVIICRVGYCPHCEKSHYPRIDQVYLAFGSASLSYKIATSTRTGNYGFVPHIYKCTFTNAFECKVQISCAMYECGVVRETKYDHPSGMYYYFYHPKEYRTETWKVSRFTALMGLTSSNHFTRQYFI